MTTFLVTSSRKRQPLSVQVIDFNKLLIKSKETTFCLIAGGDSLSGDGIFPGDLLVVDKLVDPYENAILIFSIDGEFTMKRLEYRKDHVALISSNPAYPPIIIKEGEELKRWGVLRYVIKEFESMYALCDGNNFFCSCERVFDSSLEGKPVIVLSNNDGCAIARSNEAKALGIKMGANFFEIEKLVKRHNVQVFSTNFVLYADMSVRMKGMLSRYCPEVEDYSIDEAFLDFSGFEKTDLRKHYLEMAKAVKQGIGIPVSVGVAPTKTLAKVANKFAKKYAGYQSVCVIDNEEKRIKALQKTAIGDVWGIGRRHEKRLLEKGIQTAYDFTQLPKDWVRKHMTIVGERTWRELCGESCVKMETIEPDKQSIMVSRSFGKMIEDFSIINEAVVKYACMAAAKLRKQKSCAKSLLIFIDTNPFREDLPQYSQHIIINMPVATNSSMEILDYVKEGLQKIYRPGFKYKKAGVMLMDICGQNVIQGNIWDKIDREKHKRLMEVLDKTNDRYGRNTLKFAILGDGEQWKIKQELLMPCYTTRISDFQKTK